VTDASHTVGEWLATRTPAPPQLLRERIILALGAAADRDVTETESVCLDAAERVLTRLLGRGRGKRDEAADLLAADALVTYALEFAASASDHFEGNATSAIERFGRLVEEDR
jgi:hypothetical protein